LIAQRTTVHFFRTHHVGSAINRYLHDYRSRARFDITPRAIRFYEDQGLLAPDREGPSGRRRVYNGRERTRLKLTLRGKRLGLTLNEIREILDLYESPRDTAPQLERFLHLLAQHRGTLERQLEDLQAQLAEIDQHERQCKAAGCASCRERRRQAHCLRLPHPSTSD
jgi:DNA-binding transcriptional MerR regulator